MTPPNLRSGPPGTPGDRRPPRYPEIGLPETIPEEPAYTPAPAPAERDGLSRFDKAARAVIEVGILALIVFSPLPAGSVSGWAVLILEMGIAVLTALYFLMSQPPRVNSHLASKLKYSGAAFAAFFLLVIPFQLLPLPRSIARLVSSKGFALREAYVPGFAGVKRVSLSLAPSRTLEDGLLLVACALAGFLVVRVFVHRRQIIRLMTVIAASGAFQALFGLSQLPRNQPSLLFYPKTFNLDSVTGTFVNRNHFSGYLELVIPIVLALIFSRIDLLSMPGMKWRRRLAVLTSRGVAGNVILTIGFLFMALGILKSNSRSGAILLGLTFLIFAELIALTFGRMKLRRSWLLRILMIGLVLVTLIALYSGVESMIGRFSIDSLLQDGRPRYWMTILRVIKDFPLLGTGLGTFALSYEAYETLGLQGMFDHAHNDYLEYLSELGIAGFGILFAGILFILVDAFRVWFKRRNVEAKSLAMGGLVSAVIILLHSLTDFNLHIPATMFLFAVVLGLTWSAVYYRKS
jgi:O-antigen ligase